MRRISTLAILLVLASCASGEQSTNTSPDRTGSAPPSASQSTPTDIVGSWRGQHTCEGIIDALQEAGFEPAVALQNVIDNGLVPGADGTKSLDLDHPCADAIAIDHSHVFSADGQFQSLDQQGEEVDFGTWEAIDEDTIVIGAPDRADVSFDYAVAGDVLTLEPQIEEGCLEFECQWAVMVAMSWSELERVAP